MIRRKFTRTDRLTQLFLLGFMMLGFVRDANAAENTRLSIFVRSGKVSKVGESEFAEVETASHLAAGKVAEKFNAVVVDQEDLHAAIESNEEGIYSCDDECVGRVTKELDSSLFAVIDIYEQASRFVGEISVVSSVERKEYGSKRVREKTGSALVANIQQNLAKLLMKTFRRISREGIREWEPEAHADAEVNDEEMQPSEDSSPEGESDAELVEATSRADERKEGWLLWTEDDAVSLYVHGEGRHRVGKGERIKLPVGSHLIEVEDDCFETEQRRIQVYPNDVATARFSLRAKTASVRLLFPSSADEERVRYVELGSARVYPERSIVQVPLCSDSMEIVFERGQSKRIYLPTLSAERVVSVPVEIPGRAFTSSESKRDSRKEFRVPEPDPVVRKKKKNPMRDLLMISAGLGALGTGCGLGLYGISGIGLPAAHAEQVSVWQDSKSAFSSTDRSAQAASAANVRNHLNRHQELTWQVVGVGLGTAACLGLAGICELTTGYEE